MPDTPTATRRASPLLLAISALFVACLVTANIIASKVVTIGPATVSVAVVMFPLTYLFADVLTEVWGYALTRTVIWTGFFANIVAVLFLSLAVALPPSAAYGDQDAMQRILGQSPRLVTASLIAYLCGEFLNSFILARMKIWTSGRFLWVRTIGSTVVGQGVDTAVFISLAFAGTLPGGLVLIIIRDQWIVKVLYETVATPVTYAIVNLCKRVEGLDTYDREISFAPIVLRGRLGTGGRA